MLTLGAEELLRLWESGSGAGSVDRALAVLSAAYPDAAREELLDLPLGRRDALLLGVHAELVGARLDCVVSCPACDEALELELAVADLLGSARDEDLRVRLPTSADLLAAAAEPDLARRRAALVERVAGASLNEPELRELAAAIERADPLTDVRVASRCPECDTSWSAQLDVGEFVWRELAARARALMAEVDGLARRYGWAEADILAMSEIRRRWYLEVAM